MAVQPVGDAPTSDANRKVWVENVWHEDYVETYRGDEIRVPAKGKIVMNNLRANRFLSEVRGNYEVLPNGQYKGVPKALRIVEMTAEEVAQLEGKSVVKVKEEREAAANVHVCAQCGDTVATEQGLKAHITRLHSA